MTENIKYWVEISEYDLETADAMFRTKRFLYVGFMCHQSIEKILKALYTKIYNEVVPYTHNLGFLISKTNLVELMDENKNSFINELEPMNVESRYPKYKEQIRAYLSEEKCIDILAKTKEMHEWIKQML